MRHKVGITALALLTMVGVVLAAGPSLAEQRGPSTPKGQVFAGTEAMDPFASPWVAAIGRGANPVPMVFVDYETGPCTNANEDRLPAIFSGLVNVGPNDNGTRTVTDDNGMDLMCVNAEMQRFDAGVDFVYDIASGTLTSAFPDSPTQTTMVRICTGQSVAIDGVNFSFNYINGTNGADIIDGTPGPDIIDGKGGRDTINGGAGNDVICAGNGNDLVHGDGGLDILLGEDGRDRLFGDAGKDIAIGGNNSSKLKPEVIKGGGGWDRLFGFQGKDNMFGGAGNDILWGGPLYDKLYGGQGTDDECYDKATNVKTGCEITAP